MSEAIEEADKKVKQDSKNYAYDITQKLTYYVITVELALCGYMLLNAEKLSGICGAAYIFLVCGLAALIGVLWRFCYNITFHAHAHFEGELSPQNKYFKTKTYKTASYLQGKLHDVYVLLTAISFLWILGAGFIYLSNL
jgi:hypothetical protein